MLDKEKFLLDFVMEVICGVKVFLVKEINNK